MVCRYCGKEIADGAEYCNYCGESVSDGSDTAADGAKARSKSRDWKKIVTYISWGCIAFAALAGLIFTFCIGVNANFGDVGVNATIYDYFGSVYDECSDAVAGSLDATVQAQAYIPAVVGTLVSAGAVVSAVVLAILTSVACVNRFLYKKGDEEKWVKLAAATYLSFALFSAAFLALNSCGVTSYGVTVNAGYNPATLAGLVLGGTGLGGYLACKTALRIADFKDGKVIVKTAVTFVAGVVATILAALAVLPVVKISSGSSASVESGFLPLLQLSLQLPGDNSAAVVACGFIGYLVQITLVAFAVLTVLSAVKYVSLGNAGKILPYSITCAALSAVNMIFAIVTGEVYASGLSSDGYHLGYGAPIAVFVLSVAVLAAVIVAKKLFTKTAREDGEEAEEVEETEEAEEAE